VPSSFNGAGKKFRAAAFCCAHLHMALNLCVQCSARRWDA
jgi:hypothetical protein